MLMETNSRMPPRTYFFIWVGVCRKRIIGKFQYSLEMEGTLIIEHSALSIQLSVVSSQLSGGFYLDIHLQSGNRRSRKKMLKKTRSPYLAICATRSRANPNTL